MPSPPAPRGNPTGCGSGLGLAPHRAAVAIGFACSQATVLCWHPAEFASLEVAGAGEDRAGYREVLKGDSSKALSTWSGLASLEPGHMALPLLCPTRGSGVLLTALVPHTCSLLCFPGMPAPLLEPLPAQELPGISLCLACFGGTCLATVRLGCPQCPAFNSACYIFPLGQARWGWGGVVPGVLISLVFWVQLLSHPIPLWLPNLPPPH